MKEDFMFSVHTKQSYSRFDNAQRCVSLSPGIIEEIVIGIYPDGGDQGTEGEFIINWRELGGKLTPCIEMFGDAFALLVDMRPLFDALAQSHEPTPREAAEILRRLGFKERIYDAQD